MSIDRAQNIWVAATGNCSVLKISPAGKVTSILRTESPWSPTGVAVADDDIYVLEYLHTATDNREDWVPRTPITHMAIGVWDAVTLGQRRYEEAILELEKSKALGRGSLATWDLGFAYAVSGRKADARRALQELPRESKGGYFASFPGGYLCVPGREDRAFEYLQSAYEQGDWVQLKSDPFLDNLRSDPRFPRLLRQFI